MNTVNKATAAVLAGALTTILVWVLNQYAHAGLTSEISGALQTVITAAIVYFSPANQPA